MKGQDYRVLEKLYEGEEIDQDEYSESLDRLERLNLVQSVYIVDSEGGGLEVEEKRDSISLTERGLEVFLDERQHYQSFTVDASLLMTTLGYAGIIVLTGAIQSVSSLENITVSRQDFYLKGLTALLFIVFILAGVLTWKTLSD